MILLSLDITKQRLTSAKNRVDRFIDHNIRTWAMQTILLPGQRDIENSISQKASEGLKLEKTGFMKVDLTWELRGENNEPIHFYLEYGTGPHLIRPKGKLYGGANALHWKSTAGRDIFATVVRHPGSKKHVGIAHGIKEERMPDLINKIVSECQNYMEINKI